MLAQQTFLQLVQKAYREYGLPGAQPTSVANQSGRANDVIAWVLDAENEIHLARQDWTFDWDQGTFALDSSKDAYDPSVDFGITGGIREFIRAVSSNYAYPTAQGVSGRNFLRILEWAEFRGINVPSVSGNTPVCCAVRPDGKVVYYPKPSADVTAVHEYYRMPNCMSSAGYAPAAADGSNVPRIPAQFQLAIAWKAVMIGCGKTGNFSRFDTAEEQYERLYQTMLRECTPRVVLGASLA